MFRSTEIGRVMGIPIRVHSTLWIFLPILALRIGPTFFWGLVLAAGLFISVALHELGHSAVALAKGCRVREILLMPFGGIAKLESMPSRPADEIQMALAGPAVSFLIAVIAIFLGHRVAALNWRYPAYILSTLGWINGILAAFNLLPSFPMDGGRVFRAWMTPRVGRAVATQRAAKLGKIFAVIFGLWGLASSNFMLIAIAVFIYIMAGAENRIVQAQEHFRTGGFSPFAQQPDVKNPAPWEISVGPPPYKKQGHRSKASDRFKPAKNFFDSIFDKRN